MRRNTNKRPAGFTLTELAVVLGVVGLMIAAIWMAGKSVSDNRRATQAVQDILYIASNIRSTYTSASQFSDATETPETGKLITSGGIFPSSLLDPGSGTPPTALKNDWDGAVIVYFTSGGNQRRFRIAYQGTPQDACFRIASQLLNLGTSDAPTQWATYSGTLATATGVSSATINATCAANSGITAGVVPSTEFEFNIH